jgi:hypothetical protein
MRVILTAFVKRVPREGFKSLAVPALAFVFVVLISVMNGTRINLAADLEDTMDSFPVRVELSCSFTLATEDLHINSFSIRLFTDPEARHSVAEYLRDVEMNRVLPIKATIPTINVDWWTGITSPKADFRLDPLAGVYIEYLAGYDEGIFRTRERVGVVGAEIFDALDTVNPIIALEHTEIRVVGVVHGVGNHIFSPFWTVSEVAEAMDLPVYTSLMRAYMADNRLIHDFASVAIRNFAPVGDSAAGTPQAGEAASFALTIFDTVYNDVTRRLQQNIQLINAATPFIYALSVLIGFIASYMLTRRRKPEFAVMRSIGVSKRHVFWGALAEQAFLCVIGAVAGFVVFAVIRGSWLLLPPVLFTACYIMGSVFAARRAAGTDILKILREKE